MDLAATLKDLAPYAVAVTLFLGVLKLLHYEVRLWLDRRTEARQLRENNLDPILKAADELYGKLLKLAKSDFKTTNGSLKAPPSNLLHDNLQYASLIYLFGVFWGRLEILKSESNYAELTKHRLGRKLAEFIRCLESTDVRLVNRISQRAIGENFIDRDGGTRKTIIPFINIAEKFESDERFRSWLQPLNQKLANLHDKKIRQELLRYGVIVQLMQDELDNQHKITKERPAYPNKLNTRSKIFLGKRIFKFYFGRVSCRRKYLGEHR